MKKGVFVILLLVCVLTSNFSQSVSLVVNNTATYIEAVNEIRSGGINKTYTIIINGNWAKSRGHAVNQFWGIETIPDPMCEWIQINLAALVAGKISSIQEYF